MNRLFIFFAMCALFLTSAEYAITRPASQALFLTHFSAAAFPWVWLATVPLNFLVICTYNRFLPQFGPAKMLLILTLLISLFHCITALLLPLFPSLIFLQFAWKDIYILLMFKQIWSMIHTTIPSLKAQYLYGFIFSAGTVGSLLGSLIPGYLAIEVGSETLFFFTFPLYLFLFLSYRAALARSSLPLDFTEQLNPHPTLYDGFSLIRKNRFLSFVLLLVILMQVSVALAEYQFSAHLETHILDKDLRTAYWGRAIFATQALSGALQLFGAFFLVKLFGTRGSHLFIPLALLASTLASWALPTFALISFSYIFIKAVDFSLFGVLREMLYIPLQLDEKFRAKAVIDVFAYRTSKALASLALLILQWTIGLSVLPGVSWFIFALWIGVVTLMFARVHPPAGDELGKGTGTGTMRIG